MSAKNNDLVIDHVFEISNFEQQVKSMLVLFLNPHHAGLMSAKIVSELMQTNIVKDDHVSAYELWMDNK